MTKRTARQHRMLELKSKLMSKVANKLFTFKETGIDGFVKRKFLPATKPNQNATS
jgi:hypothetical protein